MCNGTFEVFQESWGENSSKGKIRRAPLLTRKRVCHASAVKSSKGGV